MLDPGPSLDDAVVDIFVVAPFLWAGSAEESLEPVRVNVALQPGTTYKLIVQTGVSASAGGLVAETHGSARVRDLDASLTTSQ